MGILRRLVLFFRESIFLLLFVTEYVDLRLVCFCWKKCISRQEEYGDYCNYFNLAILADDMGLY